MNNILKVEFYDEFSCIADRCSFTCCEGWQIIIDTDTYNKWESQESESKYFSKNVRKKNRNNESERFIKMGPRKCCPFLDEKGLCDIVIKHGEDYLSKTCKAFPRQENSFGKLDEYSLSCACPAVVDIINSLNGTMKFLYDGEESAWNNLPSAYKIRETMISIMQNSKFPLKDRILLIFQMLLSMKKELVITNEIVSKYQDQKYLLSLSGIWSGIKTENADSCREKKELFLDIVQNYRTEKSINHYLNDISELAEDLDSDNCHTKWNDFIVEFASYEKLIENTIVSKIFANCISDDIDEMIMSFQVVITEYVMVEYSAFLKWLINRNNNACSKKSSSVNKDVDYNDIRDYIVLYSRIIGYNTDGIKEFWEDSFDEAVWELSYMLLLVN